MTAPRPLVVLTMARTGGTLLTHVLSANPAIEVVADPWMPIMKALRNAVLDGAGLDIDPAMPFIDGYGDNGRRRHLDALLAGHAEVACPATWSVITSAAARRCEAEAPDLAADIARLEGSTIGEALRGGLTQFHRRRGDELTRWVGFKEVWSIALLPALARGLPGSRFLILLRDPRAVVASMDALGERHPEQRGHLLSYTRHWRMLAALALHLVTVGPMVGRVGVLRYEDLIEHPKTFCPEVCRFLSVEPSAAMWQPRSYLDRSSGRPWRGNSSFDPVLSGFERTAVERWRERLAPDRRRLVEYVCGPEMAAWGYEPMESPQSMARRDLVGTLSDDDRHDVSWRSSSDDPADEIQREASRWTMLGEADAAAGAIRLAFLFPGILPRLRGQRASLTRSVQCPPAPSTVHT